MSAGQTKVIFDLKEKKFFFINVSILSNFKKESRVT